MPPGSPNPECAAQAAAGWAYLAQGRYDAAYAVFHTLLEAATACWGAGDARAGMVRARAGIRAAEGAAVVVISQDLDELLEIADRFAALNGGRLTDPRPVQGLTVDEIGLMMGGAHGMEVAHHGA